MEKVKYYIQKYKMLILTLTFLFLFSLFMLYIVLRSDRKDKTIEIVKEITEEPKVEKVSEVSKYKVDIKGYVKKPGVYELDSESRVIDVINKAGGLSENANTEYINLSKKITDEMVIIIYSNGELEKFKETDKQVIYIEYECKCPDNKNDACIEEGDIVNTSGTKDSKSEKINNVKDSNESLKDNKVSINTATLEELMTLNGIGESKAKSIIEYREENGEFNTLEDIMNVSGIGESAYTKIKDSIKL